MTNLFRTAGMVVLTLARLAAASQRHPKDAPTMSHEPRIVKEDRAHGARVANRTSESTS